MGVTVLWGQQSSTGKQIILLDYLESLAEVNKLWGTQTLLQGTFCLEVWSHFQPFLSQPLLTPRSPSWAIATPVSPALSCWSCGLAVAWGDKPWTQDRGSADMTRGFLGSGAHSKATSCGSPAVILRTFSRAPGAQLCTVVQHSGEIPVHLLQSRGRENSTSSWP